MKLYHQIGPDEQSKAHDHAMGMAVDEIINGAIDLDDEGAANPEMRKDLEKALKSLGRIKDNDAKFDFVMNSRPLMHIVEALTHQMLNRAIFVEEDDFLIFPDEYMDSDEEHLANCPDCRAEHEAAQKDGAAPALPPKKQKKHSVN
jgi:hypothetical protein